MDITSLVDAARKRRDQKTLEAVRQRREVFRNWLLDLGLTLLADNVLENFCRAEFYLFGSEHGLSLDAMGRLELNGETLLTKEGAAVYRTDIATGDDLLLLVADHLRNPMPSMAAVYAVPVEATASDTTISIALQPEEPKPDKPARGKSVRPAKG